VRVWGVLFDLSLRVRCKNAENAFLGILELRCRNSESLAVCLGPVRSVSLPENGVQR
jgi:hypothetical protein